MLYSTEVDAIIGIQPDQGNPPIAQLVFGVDVGGRYDFHFSSMDAKKSQEIEFTGKIYNNGFMDFVDTPIAYLVYNEDSTFMQAFGQSTFSSSSDVSLSAAFDGLETGDYLLAVGYRFDDEQDWIPIVAEGAFTFFKMRTTADSVYICIPGHDFDPDPEQQSISQTSAQRSTLNAKRLVNGHLYIIHGDQTFNAQGARVK